MWIGTVTRVDVGGHAWLSVPDLAAREFGPVEGLEAITLATGDRVLVGSMDRRPEDLAIIRRLP